MCIEQDSESDAKRILTAGAVCSDWEPVGTEAGA